MARTVTVFVASGVAAMFAAVAGAQGLSDPTRPPPQFAGREVAAVDSGNPLHSIVISGTRKAAVINGQWVPLGGIYGDARLVEVTPTEIVLKSRQSSKTLRLHPGVRKSPAKTIEGNFSGGIIPREAEK